LTREQVDHLNKNSTNPPPVGHYRPDVRSIYVKERSIMIPKEHKSSPVKKEKKTVICEHLKKNLDPVSRVRASSQMSAHKEPQPEGEPEDQGEDGEVV